MKNKTLSEKTPPYFSKSTYIQLIGAVAIFCLFHDVWFHFFTNKIVEPYLSIIKKHWLKDIAFGTLSLGNFLLLRQEVIAISTKSPKKHLGINKHFSLFVISIALYYSLFRFQGLLNYESLALCSKIVYSDIFLLFGLLNVVVLVVDVWLYKNKEREPKADFFLDNPIEKVSEDKLQYNNYAKNLASKINSSIFSKPFAIGVTSEWGTGKTSFIKLVKENLNADILQIDFSPWHYNSTEKMLSEFFSLFEQKLNENNHFNNEISRLISSYRQRLVSEKEGFLAKAINTLNIFKQEDSLKNLFDKINNKLTALDLNIVVFIDDLDRLSPDEVYEVLRLIRNSGGFKRTCFVVAYDRDYVINSLKQLKIYSPKTYLEKLFQIEASLPYFAKTPLENEIKFLLQKILNTAQESKLITDELFVYNTSIIDSNEIFIKVGEYKNIPILLSWITTIREAVRLANSISLNTKNLFKEVLFKEFVHIELLRLKFPNVYKLLSKERDRFFDSNYNLLSLKTNENKEIELEKHLQEHKDALLLNTGDIVNVIALLKALFGLEKGIEKTHFFYNEDLNKISIRNPSAFYAYFSYGIIPEILSNERFLKLLDKPLKDAKIEIDKIIGSVLEYQFLDRLKSVSVEEVELNTSRYKNLLEIFIYTESIPMVGMGFDYFYTYINPNGRFVEQLNIQNLKQFLRPLFDNLDYALQYKAGFVSYLGKRAVENSDGFFTSIFEPSEIEDLLVKYLKFCCRQSPVNHNLVDNIWVLCNLPGIVRHLHPNEQIHKDVTIPKAREVFKNYIAQDGLDEFFKLVIQKNGYLNYRFVLQVFQPSNTTFETLGKDTLQNFYSFLDTLDEQKWPLLNEYKQLKFEKQTLD